MVNGRGTSATGSHVDDGRVKAGGHYEVKAVDVRMCHLTHWGCFIIYHNCQGLRFQNSGILRMNSKSWPFSKNHISDNLIENSENIQVYTHIHINLYKVCRTSFKNT